MFRYSMPYSLLCLVAIGFISSCNNGKNFLDIKNSDKELMEVRHYLKNLKEGTRLRDIEYQLGLSNPYHIESPTVSSPWYTVSYRMRCYAVKVTAYLGDDVPNAADEITTEFLFYNGQAEFSTVFGDGVFPAILAERPIVLEYSESDRAYLHARTYLKSIPPGTRIDVLERELNLSPPWKIEPPSRLFPVYSLFYKSKSYNLTITADAPSYDRFSITNRSRHPSSNELFYKGQILLWETITSEDN